MVGRKDLRTDQNAPGPGAYNPSVSQAKDRPTSVRYFQRIK